MTASDALDVYQAACLAGGLDRMVDTAVVALLETGRIRVQHSGELSVVANHPQHPIEAAVLAAIGTGGWRCIDSVRCRAATAGQLALLVEQLVTDGLLTRNTLLRLLRRPFAPTAAGRRTLRQLRAHPPVRGVAAGTSMAQVALHGTGRMPDGQLRQAVFQRPALVNDDPRTRRARTRARHAAGGATAYGAGCGTTGGHGSCGGHAGCGGGGAGCGGAGCGGGGCGGG